MKSIIIIGQDTSPIYRKVRPWSKGKSSLRLMKWFGVKNYSGLNKIAHLTNISKFESRIEAIGYIMRKHARHVFLVGKLAQRIFPYDCQNLSSRIIERKIFHFIPHPSGRNVSCNNLDKKILNFIKEII